MGRKSRWVCLGSLYGLTGQNQGVLQAKLLFSESRGESDYNLIQVVRIQFLAFAEL